MVCVSDEAIRVMEQRKTPIASFYANLLTFRDYYKNKWFPYTMPISDIYGLRTALENVKADKEIHKRHADIAAATRQAVTEAGLKLYLERGYCATVTVVEVPEGVDSAVLLDTMTEKYGVMIAGCFDFLAGKVIRLGHMGENANVEDVTMMLYALECALADLGYPLKASMRDVFVREMKNK